tara:strand:+ start:295 stop:501 length:207 start_codon:yes stop_codon:yes gene_type:complete
MSINNQNTLQSLMEAVRGNESLMKAYASRRCKECLGRGYKEVAVPLDKAEIYVCPCVCKNVKKEFNNG